MDSALQVVIAIIGSGAFFSFLQFLVQRRDNKNDKIEELCKKIDEGLETQRKTSEERHAALRDEIRKSLEDKENMVQERLINHKDAIKSLNDAITKLTENDIEQSKYMKYIGDELMGLAHQQLVTLTDHYQMRGAITLKEKASLDAIFKPYHDGLGGNGDGKIGYEFAMQLPIVTDAEAIEMDKKLQLNIA